MLRTAILSEDGKYRYRLSREWGTGAGRVSWLMMNPSTADALVDDATIRKCVEFSQRWGFNALDVINLYSLRSRDPKVLLTIQKEELDGPEADIHYHNVLHNSSLLVLAWGCESTLKSLGIVKLSSNVVNDVKRWYPKLIVKCLGQSKTGNPYHPLMLAYDTPLRDVEV
jgi:hypothetical protein